MLPVIEHDFDAEHVIRGYAVGEGVRAAGVVGDIAADGASGLTARIGSIEQTVLGDYFGDIRIDHAGLDNGDAILQIDFQNPVEPGERKDDSTFGGHRPAR